MKAPSIYQTAAITFGLALACTGLIHWNEYVRMSVPEFLGSALGGTIGLWGLSGIAALCSKPENKRLNWIIVMLILGALIWFNVRPRANDEANEWHETKSGNKYRLVK